MATIQLSPADNIVVLTRSVPGDGEVFLGGSTIRIPRPLGLGHKLALCNIRTGEKILKYGVPIGSATCDIALGEHVHLHNMKSDYLPTYTLDAGREFHAAL